MKSCPRCKAQHTKAGTYCSRSCANSRGPRSDDFKNKVRKKLKGRKLSPEHIEALSGDNHGKRKNRGFSPIKYVSKKCYFCDEYFVCRGDVIKPQKYCSKDCFISHKRSTKTAFENYRRECKFNFNVFDYPEEFDLSLIEKYGIYSAKNRGDNQTGISRDHRISVRFGFDNNIPSSVISHPANCELMRHHFNNKKNAKCSISIERLMEEINIWKIKYG